VGTALFFVYTAGIFFINWQGLFEPAKVIWFYIGTIPLFLYWIVKIYKQKNIKFYKADYFYFFWLLILLISSVTNHSILDSLVGTSYRHQGIIFFFALWIIGKTFRSLSSQNQKNFLNGLIMVAAIQAVLVIYQKLNQSTLIGTMGEANAVAGALLPFLPYINNPHIFLLISLGTLVTGSKIAVAVVVMILLIKLPLKNYIKYFLGLILLLTAGFLIINNTVSLSSDSLFENRSIIWSYSIEAILQKPVFGYGPETNEAIYDNYFVEDNRPLTFIIIDRAHNVFFGRNYLVGINWFSYLCSLVIYIATKNSKPQKPTTVNFGHFVLCFFPAFRGYPLGNPFSFA